jgi:multiple sugar transport system substrate-binding protein
MVAAYTKLHPDVHINVVSQSNDTLIGGFRLAAQSRSGPDIDTQWATLPTLAPYWTGSAVAISDYLPASETSQWINTSENTVGSKIVAMPLYLIGTPIVWNKAMFKQAGLDPDKAPTTWADLMADCAALKAHGITPIGMGNKDGYFGAWMFSIYAKQELDSLDQIKSAIGNTGSFRMDQLDSVLHKLYALLQDLVQKGYLNSDVASLDLDQGGQLFPQKKVAISFNTDSVVLSWGQALGQDAIGTAPPPRWGSGKLAGTYDVTQSSDQFITTWAKDKPAAAAFLAWLHQPANLDSLFKIGAFPADRRFPIASVSDPLAKRLLELDAAPNSIWLENYLPPQVDSDADLPAGELILSNSGTPDQAVAIWDRVVKQWRVQHASEFKQFKKWAAGGG